MKNHLQALIERARALNEMVSDEIDNSCSNFCRFCSENCCFCGVAVAPFEERQRLISIRESMKNVEKMLVFLQVHEFVFLHNTFLSFFFVFFLEKKIFSFLSIFKPIYAIRQWK